MLVSVIIPNYNHAPFLKKRIESVLHQTFQNIEVIILDDCSTDDSKQIIEHYRENSKITSIIYNTQNSGSAFKQWQKGFELANGDFIWIAESDDYSDENFLIEMTQILNQNEDAGIVYCNSTLVNESDEIIGVSSNKLGKRWQIDYTNNGRNEIINYFVDFCPIINVSSCIFRRKNILNAEKKFLNLKVSGDYYLYCNILRNSSISYSAKPLNYFRQLSSSVTAKSKNNKYYFLDKLIVLNSIKRLLSFDRKKQVSFSNLSFFTQHFYQFNHKMKTRIMLLLLSFSPMLFGLNLLKLELLNGRFKKA